MSYAEFPDSLSSLLALLFKKNQTFFRESVFLQGTAWLVRYGYRMQGTDFISTCYYTGDRMIFEKRLEKKSVL